MKRLAPLLLFAFVALASAQDAALRFPKVPAGFDEGRKNLLADLAEEPITSRALVERLFEEADLRELADFCALHLTAEEKSLVDAQLEADGELTRARDTSAFAAFFVRKGFTPARVASAMGAVLEAQKYTLAEVAAWLYARGFNHRALQAALNGERLDSLKLRRELRTPAKKSKSPFETAMWEFNLADGREQAGGHYDGAQLVDCLVALGWGHEEFAAALGVKEPKKLDATARMLIEWGDPALAWRSMELLASESDLFKAAMKVHAQPSLKVFEVGLRRARTVDRWFRTGGAGVVGVYSGPWPDDAGQPKAPVVRELQEGQEPADLIDDPLKAHFKPRNPWVRIVVYEDGSARALLTMGLKALNFGPASPPGNTEARSHMYEGRVSVAGRNALLYSVFSGGSATAPVQIELANVEMRAAGALLVADIDDGTHLTPFVLKRGSRLVEAP
jgi:hypothetical protein